MSCEPLRYNVTLVNLQGLHIRPIKNFVELVSTFRSTVFVSKADQRVEGNSPLGLLGLAAEHGSELTLEVCGPDQQEALDALVAFLNGLVQEDQEEATG